MSPAWRAQYSLITEIRDCDQEAATVTLLNVDSRFFALPERYFDPGQPVAFDESKFSWSLSTYDDVQRLLTDRAGFTASLGLSPEDLRQLNPAYAGLWLTDGPRHDDLRSAVADPFRAGVLRALEPRIREIAVELVENIDGNRFDLAELTRLLPSKVMCLILDVDLDAAGRIISWLDEVADVTSVLGFPPQTDMADYLGALIENRRSGPGTGLLDELLAAQAADYRADGQPLSDWDLIGYLAMLLIAGIDTTSAGIGNALLFLTEYGHAEKLAAQPAGIPAAIEEVLRWYPPFPVATRLAVQEVTFGGISIAAGTPVGGRIAAANRDPARFTDPDTFKVDRTPNQHLSFGRGAHYCLGAPLARLEMTVTVEEVLARMPGLRWDSSVPLQRHAGVVHRLTEAIFTR